MLPHDLFTVERDAGGGWTRHNDALRQRTNLYLSVRELPLLLDQHERLRRPTHYLNFRMGCSLADMVGDADAFYVDGRFSPHGAEDQLYAAARGRNDVPLTYEGTAHRDGDAPYARGPSPNVTWPWRAGHVPYGESTHGYGIATPSAWPGGASALRNDDAPLSTGNGFPTGAANPYLYGDVAGGHAS